MDIRDPIDQQLRDHIDTILRLAEMETPAALVWAEISLYLHESGNHIRDYILPKVEVKTPHVNLRGTVTVPKIAEFVGSTSSSDETVPNLFPERDEANAFLKSNGAQR